MCVRVRVDVCVLMCIYNISHCKMWSLIIFKAASKENFEVYCSNCTMEICGMKLNIEIVSLTINL